MSQFRSACVRRSHPNDDGQDDDEQDHGYCYDYADLFLKEITLIYGRTGSTSCVNMNIVVWDTWP